MQGAARPMYKEIFLILLLSTEIFASKPYKSARKPIKKPLQPVLTCGISPSKTKAVPSPTGAADFVFSEASYSSPLTTDESLNLEKRKFEFDLIDFDEDENSLESISGATDSIYAPGEVPRQNLVIEDDSDLSSIHDKVDSNILDFDSIPTSNCQSDLFGFFSNFYWNFREEFLDDS